MKKLAIIAGQGHLPADIASAARKDGLDVLVLEISGQSDASFEGVTTAQIQLGSIAATRQLMIDHGCDCVVMAGKVKRPSLANLMPDAGALKLLGKTITKGDDGLLRLVSAYFAEAGVVTITPSVFMPDRLLEVGTFCAAGADPEMLQDDIGLGTGVLAALSEYDVGQAAIVQDGRVLAIEAAEGTQEMLRRAALAIDASGPAAILVKLPKRGQDMRLDMPVIGLDTIAQSGASGVGLIAIAAGGVLLSDPADAMAKSCVTHGVSLVGLAADTDATGTAR